jgi:hypothetical protein
MSEATPTTEIIRKDFAMQHGTRFENVNGQRFDRWLAAHDAEVRAECNK